MERFHQIQGLYLKMIKQKCFHNDKNITTKIKQTTVHQISHNKNVSFIKTNNVGTVETR